MRWPNLHLFHTMKTTLANTIANTLLVITMLAIVSLIFAATQI